MNSIISGEDTDSISSDKSSNEDEFWIKVMNICQQNNPIPFGLEFASWTYSQLEPIDNGSYSLVIKGFHKQIDKKVVFKVINVLSLRLAKKFENTISLEGKEMFADVFNEIIASKALSNLHLTTIDCCFHEFKTHSFPKIISSCLCHGSVPNYFLIKPTNDSMDVLENIKLFREFSGIPREYLVLSMKHCGEPLWKMTKTRSVNAYQLLSICYQLTLALTVSECIYEFEHRDLHLSNVLIKKTKKTHISYVFKTETYQVDSSGYKAFIIDTTFSRIKIGQKVYFTSLSKRLNLKLLLKNPDLQDWVYQMMAKEAADNWEQWMPVSNIYWLIYLYKTIIKSKIVDKCKDNKPKLILKQMLNKISNCKTLEEFIPHIINKK